MKDWNDSQGESFFSKVQWLASYREIEELIHDNQQNKVQAVAARLGKCIR
jgi:hypothetical protein